MPGRRLANVGLRPLVAKTCVTCGVFKQAEEFWQTARGYFQSACKRCVSANTMRANIEVNRITAATAKNARKDWTLSDIQKLEEMTEQGLSARKIGQALGRTTDAIYNYKTKHYRAEET